MIVEELGRVPHNLFIYFDYDKLIKKLKISENKITDEDLIDDEEVDECLTEKMKGGKMINKWLYTYTLY